jgi:hypothetical protein
MTSPPKPERLPILETQRGPVHEWLPGLLKVMTPYFVAVSLGVYPNTVRYWQKRLREGYVRVDGKWVKVEREQNGAAS